MPSNAVSQIIAFAQAASRDGDKAAIAAAAAIAEMKDDDHGAWGTLYHWQARHARWASALDIARIAAQRIPDSAAVALLGADALIQLGRRAEAEEALASIADRFPTDFGALDRLSGLAWHGGDPVTCLELVERAVSRGLTGADHIIDIGISSAIMMGEFGRARALQAFFLDDELRSGATQKILSEEMSWREADRLLQETYGGVASKDTMLLASKAGEKTLVRHMAIRAILRADSIVDLHFLIHFSHSFGPSGWALSSWAATEGRRSFPDVLIFEHEAAAKLLVRGDFLDAGRALLKLVGSHIDADDVMRFLTFCCACGGVTDEDLEDAVARYLDAGLHGSALELARAFLSNRRQRGLSVLAHPATTPDDRVAESGDWPNGEPLRAVRRFYVSSPMRRPRVAVCISGQLRSYRTTWAVTRETLAPWNPTYFVSTWPDVGTSFGHHDTVDRRLPASLIQILPEHLRRRTLFESRFPHTISAMTIDSTVTVDQLRDFYGTEFVRTHDEQAFEARVADRAGILLAGSPNPAKMFFTMADANAMKSDYELSNGFIFDIVIRIRPDRPLTRLAEGDLERVMAERVLMTDYFLSGGVGDQLMISSSEVADVYTDIWHAMDQTGSINYFPGSSSRFTEYLLAEHVINSGVRLGRLIGTTPLTPLAVEVDSLWSALLRDVEEKPTLSGEERAIVAGFCEAAARQQPSDALLRGVIPPAMLDPTLLASLSQEGRRFLAERGAA